MKWRQENFRLLVLFRGRQRNRVLEGVMNVHELLGCNLFFLRFLLRNCLLTPGHKICITRWNFCQLER